MIQHIHIGMSKPSFGTHILPVFFNTTRHLYRARYVNLISTMQYSVRLAVTGPSIGAAMRDARATSASDPSRTSVRQKCDQGLKPNRS